MPYSKSSKVIHRVITFFTKGAGNKTPLESLTKVNIDSYLISIGLLSQQFGVESTFSQNFWKRGHQFIVELLEWVMFIKWFLCATIPAEYMPVRLTGDFTAYLSGDAFNYHFILIFWSSLSAISCSLFSLVRYHDKLNLSWLKPFELCKGKVKHKAIKMEMEEASEWWQVVLFVHWLAKRLTAVLFVIFAGAYIYLMVYICPREDLNDWSARVWVGVTIVWLYYTISIQFGVMAVFHLLCYYFIAKFRRLNEMVKEVETNSRMDLMTVHKTINHYMTSHNDYTKELALSNKFWQYYLALCFVIYITIICFLIELILFLKMSVLVQLLCISGVLAFTLFLVFTSFSAAAISDQIHEPYGVLNAVSQSNMPLILKTQLQIYIQRVGGPVIGFSCWDLFTFTYDGFFQALLMIGSFFLLFMDVTQSEKKHRKGIPHGFESPDLNT